MKKVFQKVINWFKYVILKLDCAFEECSFFIAQHHQEFVKALEKFGVNPKKNTRKNLRIVNIQAWHMK